MSIKSALTGKLAVTVVIVLALGYVSIATAQSGRHVRKSNPVPAATPEPEPSPVTTAEKSKPRMRLILGVDQPDSFSSVSLNTVSGVRRACAQGLEEPGWAKVEVVPRAMTRSEAVNRAKSEKDTYVVWLRIRDDTMGSRQGGTESNAYLEYMVLAPTTGKAVTSGSTYPQQRRGIVLDPRTTVEGDYYLNRAAREAADRILSKLRARLP